MEAGWRFGNVEASNCATSVSLAYIATTDLPGRASRILHHDEDYEVSCDDDDDECRALNGGEDFRRSN